MYGRREVVGGAGRLLVLAVLALACGCSPPSGGGGSDGGSSDAGGGMGTPGWQLYFPPSTRGAILVVDLPAHDGQPGGAGPFGTPDASDPWLANITDRTIDFAKDNGDGHGDAHMTIAISGDTVTVTGSANGTSGGTIVGSASGGTTGMTWCYTPATKASSVRFTVSYTGTDTISGQNAYAALEFKDWGMQTCGLADMLQWGQETGPQTDCTTDYVDVLSNPDNNQACLDGRGGGPELWWSATGGDAQDAGGGTASIDVTFTVTAAPTP